MTGIARVEKDPNWNSIRLSKGKQRILAHQLHIAADVPFGPCGLDEIKKFESTPQMANFRVVVLSKEHCDHIIYTGPDDRDHNIYLYSHDEHYDLITKMPAFMEKAYFCSQCMVGYEKQSSHKCEYTCKLCQGRDCRPPLSQDCYITCDKCNRNFKSQTCLRNHIQNKICEKKFKCEKCGILCNKKLLKDHKKSHVCGEIYCSVCRCFDSYDHKCFMQKSVIPTEYDDNGKLHDLDEPFKFIFFDFECTQNTGEHVPNYCIAQKACNECYERPLESECLVCGEEKQKVFKGENTGDEFCRWLFGEASNRGSTVIAHNFKSYDGIFIQKYLYENCIIPKLILAGGKIMSMDVAFNQIRFIDSLNFLPMPLSAMPKTFGIDELKKGFFPHFFNTKENSDYCGPMPAKENYNPNGMSSNQREEFLSWYDNQVAMGKQFRMAEEIHAYCLSDVDILRRCCMQFRSLFIDITKRTPDDVGIDPFSRCITIASACHFVYRRNFMPSQTIGLLPPSGYDPKDVQSKGAIEWLQYLEKTQNIYIRHARNEGEMKIGKYKVDGYCKEKKIIFEYNGCYFHGCPECYHSDTKNRKRDGQLMVELYHATLAKKKYIEAILPDFTYVSMWEHEWAAIKQTLSPEDFEATPIVNLDPREAFYGGRTNATCLFYECGEGERIKYVDFTSLYPFVNKYGSYPIGHPVVITENFADDISDYYGLIKCKVLPPQNLLHPVLPLKVNGKLTFPLCCACVESMQTEACTHTEQERALHSTWVSLELEKAIEKGYRVLEIEAVWHFNREMQYHNSTDNEESSTGLFTEYIDTFLKIKQEASGWPEWCKTTGDQRKYIKEYQKHEGIKLDFQKVNKNKGLRSLSKLFLNSLWGRFGMRANLPNVEVISQVGALYAIITDDENEIKDINFINEHIVEVRYVKRREFVEYSKSSNIVIAAFTTAQARLKLFNELDQLGDRTLYFDTDSLVYVQRDNAPDEYRPSLGDYLGELTDEVDGHNILSFVSGGPKNYAYKLDNGTTVCKVKGITLNYNNSQIINYDVMRHMITNIGNDDAGCVSTSNQYQITRDIKRQRITTKSTEKKYKVVYDKRIITHNFKTVPYGYIQN